MKNFKFASLFLAFVLIAAAALGQTAQCTTTLASAITNTAQTYVQLTSAACLATTPPQNGAQYLYVDNELLYMRQQGTNPTTYISTQRGASGTLSTLHASGATVYIGPGPAFSQSTTAHVGGCIPTNYLYLPVIVVNSNNALQGIYDCRNGSATAPGQWIKIAAGTNNPAGQTLSAFCTGTVGSAETEFLKSTACNGATTSTGRIFVAPWAGTIANFHAFSSAAFLGTGGSTFTVLKNGVATAIVCAPTAAATTCSDQAHAFQVAAGDVITVSFLSATSDTAANLSISLGFY